MKKAKDNNFETVVVVGGILGLIINLLHQSKIKEEKPEHNFDFQSLVLTGILGAVIGAVSFGVIKFLSSVFTSREEILSNSDEISYIASVLDSYEPDEIDREVLIKGKKIKTAINKRFRFDLLGKATYQGSKAIGTALSGLSDLDILVKFKKTSFSREGDMYYDLYDFFKNNFSDSDLVDVRQQKVSLGLIFNINGHKEIIDVVPSLRTDFVKGKNEYHLFKNPKLSVGSRKLKMNPNKQRDLGDDQNEKKEIIRLLKILKFKENLPLKSILITELTKKAFQEIRMPKEINQMLIKVIGYIRNNIKTIQIRSSDNSRICLTDSISSKDKIEIKKALDNVLFNLKSDKNFLINYFPKK